MTPRELIQRFPDIPAVLRDDPILKSFGRVFAKLLPQALQPSNCQGSQLTAGNKIYMRLVAPMGILGIGLSTPEKTKTELEKLMAAYQADPDGFTAEMLPEGTATEPGGCQSPFS